MPEGRAIAAGANLAVEGFGSVTDNADVVEPVDGSVTRSPADSTVGDLAGSEETELRLEAVVVESQALREGLIV